ncbi:dGTP triphosphohydrolase [Botrimarina mediterranea]|uniref:Deoxyguanosinetriphosphate triphosphohydrolase-like protein n=1 Tax=Botrimarina mediterranea TaxID=2528022 RepID=A0A518K3C9_9BACT|nr:dNTP triphosphohydrolase [Botrimarina mediterranea]QDV72270.1 Deoxyguanosinetriphosphate triphosphohydrolase [Botrimarina mediterranea]QDV76814.1 Deoxyguanosinetriphosphate triphosphohydrolase [Planctomycetes bacterium K2D]
MNYVERERLLLAPYAMHAADSAGRAVAEKDHPYRSPYQRDRDRITHSSAFRRLSHKTQVFTRELGEGRGDYHRSRLTHTLEVTSVARTIARALRINEDLVETLALAHDVGHPPFGHAGEAVLDELLRGVGGFNHNAQAVRLFTLLERRYPDRPGLNLTAEVLDGQRRRATKPARSIEQLEPQPIDAETPLLEVQVVDAADSIAYDSHDADDALELGLLTLGELDTITLWRESADKMRQRYTALSDADLRRATVHELIDRQVNDLFTMVTQAIEGRGIDSVETLRAAGVIARHSDAMAEQKLELESFLFRAVYRHPSVLGHRAEATAALEYCFAHSMKAPETLPAPFAAIAAEDSLPRAAGDYVATLTDRAVLEAWRPA